MDKCLERFINNDVSESVAVAYFGALAAYYGSLGCGRCGHKVDDDGVPGLPAPVEGEILGTFGDDGGLGGHGVGHGSVEGAVEAPVGGGHSARSNSGAGRFGGNEPVNAWGSQGVRGPNYARNQESRMRKKIRAEEKRLAAAEARGRSQAGFQGASWRSDLRTEKDKELHELKVERQIIQERRKLEKLKSPEQVLIDAMRHVAFAEKCAKSANDSKVAGWAATVATAYAESVARSASDSVPSLDSVTADRAAKVAREKKTASFSIAELPMNKIEQAAVDFGVFSESKLEGFRSRVERCLRYSDFQTKDAPKLSHFQRNALNDAYARYG